MTPLKCVLSNPGFLGVVSIVDHGGCNFFCSHDQGEDEESSQSDGILNRVLFYTCYIIFLTSLFGRFLFCYLRSLRSPKNTDRGSNWNAPLTHEGDKDAIQEETVQDKTINFTNVDETFPGDKEKHRCLDSRGKKGSVVISVLLLIKFVGACDLTIHVNFNGFDTICVGTNCQNTPLHNFTLALGQEICFEDQVDGIIKMNISEITIRSRYELKYYTSDYRVASLSSEGECLGLGGKNVSRHDLCGASGRLCHHEKLTALSLDQEQNSENSHRGSMCEFEEKRLYTGYSYSNGYRNTYYPCCRYSWLVESVGKRYPVYSRIEPIWIVKFTVTQNDYAQEIEFNAFDPTRTLEGFNLSANETITLTVLDAKDGTSSTHNALLIHDDFVYYINASDVYNPQSELFGDIQTPLKGDKLMFSPPKYGVCEQNDPVQYIRTYEQTCTCKCTLPESKISSFLNNLDSFYTSNDYLMRKDDNSVIDILTNFDEGSLKIKMGQWNINDSSKKAKCDIEYVQSSGCVSCNQSSYIILASRNVVTEGIVPFYSNCSFDKHYLKCDLVEDELKLVLRGNHRTCNLKMPTLKRSMLINIEYFDLNHSFNQNQAPNLTAAEEKGFSCTVTNAVTNAVNQAQNSTATGKQGFNCTVTNGMFTKTVIIIVILCSILSLIYSIIVTFLVFKERKQKAENGTETALVEI